MTTTILAPAPAVGRPARTARSWPAIPLGFVAGLALGVAARLWMRLIAEDPEFSWAGTIFIVAAFGLFGLGQGLAWSVRNRGARRPAVTVARVGAAVLTLPLFTGAGSIMLPTVLAASLAVWRTDWPRWGRVVAGVLAVPVAGFVVKEIFGEFGWGVHGWSGNAAFVAIYAVVVVALAPTVAPLADGWRLRHRRRVLVVVGAIALGLFALAAVSGV